MNTCFSINQWQEWVHQSQKERTKSDNIPSFQPCEMNVKEVSLPNRSYKCKWGSSCFQTNCPHVHPFQRGYKDAPYFYHHVPCRYETQFTACKQKCGHPSGKYCPFRHCTHGTKTVVPCNRPFCQGHCQQCI